MATEKRLIDANVLKARAIRVSTVKEHTYMKAVGTHEIDKAPTVDAVEVVRCKDCRFIIDREDGTHGCYRHFVDDCKLDDFCSYGERKDNDTRESR